MLRLLKAFVARLFGRRRPSSGPPHDPDPYAGVRQPLGRGPSAGHAAAAVMEPEPSGSVTADGWQILRTPSGDFDANSVRTKLASNSRRPS
jgi:hypothetical protein